MTPCEKMGYKVGDEFEMLVSAYGWEVGEVVKLIHDDGTKCPDFEGVTSQNRRYEDNRMFLYIENDEGYATQVKPLTIAKLRPAKKALADAIHASGKGWPDRANWAAQDANSSITFFVDKPWRCGNVWECDNFEAVDGFMSDAKIPNWHQTVLSRDEYFSAYPEKAEPVADADGRIEWNGGECPVDAGEVIDIKLGCGDIHIGTDPDWDWEDTKLTPITHYRIHRPAADAECCESVTRSIPEPEAKPSIEQLATDHRNKLDFANRKQQEADDAKAAADVALGELVKAGEALGLVIGVAKPQIANWRKWETGDEVRLLIKRGGMAEVGEIGYITSLRGDGTFAVQFPSQSGYIVEHGDIEFIRRP